MERHELVWAGHRVVYRTAGSGPPLLLIHGLLEDSSTWAAMAPALAMQHTVIAPDLLGHGESDCPATFDYSPAGHCAMLRALLDALGHHEVTVVGHSLGGGLALSFTSLFPDQVQRLALISPGGFGQHLHPLLRTISLPGAAGAIRAISARPIRRALRGGIRLLRRCGLRAHARALRSLSYMLDSLAEAGGRTGFVRSVRAVVGWRGVYACALDFIDVLDRTPLLMVWGTADRIIPISQGYAALDRCPSAELVALDGIGHVPHLTQPTFVAQRLVEFASGAVGAAAGTAIQTSPESAGHEPRSEPLPVLA